MLQLKVSSWQEGFDETCQDIMEDTFLLKALFYVCFGLSIKKVKVPVATVFP